MAKSWTGRQQTKKRHPRKDVSVTCTLYKGASAPRHPRQRDFRRKSKQRGRLARSCCRRLLRCKSPLGCLLIACDPNRGCQRQLTGVKIVERNKGWLHEANPCFFLAEALNYLFKAVATSTAHATVQPTIGLLPMPRNPIISTCAGTDNKPSAIKHV